MRTLYACCLARLGLTTSQAAELHRVRLDTVKSWSSGRNPVPDGAWDDLRALEARIVDRSEAIRDTMEDGETPEEIDVSIVDHEGALALADFFLSAEERLPIENLLRAPDTSH